MKFKILHTKLIYYRQWYHSMNEVEQMSFVGRWVMTRIIIFEGMIKEIESSHSHISRPVGNYTNYLKHG